MPTSVTTVRRIRIRRKRKPQRGFPPFDTVETLLDRFLRCFPGRPPVRVISLYLYRNQLKNEAMNSNETKHDERKYNIHFINRRGGYFIVVDDTPQCLENCYADIFGLDPQDDGDCEFVMELLDETMDIATEVSIEQVELAGVDDFKESHYVVIKM